MNNKDRSILEKLYSLLSIPAFAGLSGTQSASIEGYVSYSKDALYVIEQTRKILYAIGSGDPDAIDDLDELINEFQRWKANRIQEGWK